MIIIHVTPNEGGKVIYRINQLNVAFLQLKRNHFKKKIPTTVTATRAFLSGQPKYELQSLSLGINALMFVLGKYFVLKSL